MEDKEIIYRVHYYETSNKNIVTGLEYSQAEASCEYDTVIVEAESPESAIEIAMGCLVDRLLYMCPPIYILDEDEKGADCIINWDDCEEGFVYIEKDMICIKDEDGEPLYYFYDFFVDTLFEDIKNLNISIEDLSERVCISVSELELWFDGYIELPYIRQKDVIAEVETIKAEQREKLDV